MQCQALQKSRKKCQGKKKNCKMTNKEILSQKQYSQVFKIHLLIQCKAKEKCIYEFHIKLQAKGVLQISSKGQNEVAVFNRRAIGSNLLFSRARNFHSISFNKTRCSKISNITVKHKIIMHKLFLNFNKFNCIIFEMIITFEMITSCMFPKFS